jgi:hypothetical protein
MQQLLLSLFLSIYLSRIEPKSNWGEFRRRSQKSPRSLQARVVADVEYHHRKEPGDHPVSIPDFPCDQGTLSNQNFRPTIDGQFLMFVDSYINCLKLPLLYVEYGWIQKWWLQPHVSHLNQNHVKSLCLLVKPEISGRERQSTHPFPTARCHLFVVSGTAAPHAWCCPSQCL